MSKEDTYALYQSFATLYGKQLFTQFIIEAQGQDTTDMNRVNEKQLELIRNMAKLFMLAYPLEK